MIKIKDSIINENQIKQIDQIGDELHIIFTNILDDVWIKATFEDIEWNYGQSNIKEDEYIELSNKYQRLSNRNEELEEENKKLKETINSDELRRNYIEEFIRRYQT